ncbi:hypothetical protein OFO12_04940 [Campylobacter sp. JMF_04 NA10]|uniref:hypothetical protein n=1 Tax=Campylobacter sp. JMF_04 NA10 TaxID=2983824 RepID=UPI0022E99D39|nr:hypothetical protein [Campylobacter sp. JMF_04 NA10]MDA3076719.1 hypothetical protein [Campylobacter sp. JMF_04 NA10]
MTSNIKEAFSQNKIWAGTLASVMGFIADVCQPLAPFSKYLFFISIAIFFLSALSYLAIKNLRTKILPVIVFTVISSFVFGLMFGLQSASKDGDESGFVASVVPFFEKIQKSLGIIQKDVEQIKQTTQDIKKDTTEIKSSVQSVDQKIDKLTDNIGKQGGIVANPTTAEEFYHNARIYELNGDYGNARRAYVKYFSFKTDKLDPHLRFQKFLKIQEGKAGTKEIYNDMFEKSELITDKYAFILLEDGDKKLEKLQNFIKEHTEFAPAYFELARSYSKSVLGTQGTNDKKLEKLYIDKFIELNQAGKLVRYFIDKDELDEQIKYANERKAELDLIKFDNDIIKVNRTYVNSGYFLGISIQDEPAEIFYRIDGKGEFVSTGFYDVNYQDTGKPIPNDQISIAHTAKQPEKFVEIKYINQRGNESEIFRYEWVKKTISGKTLSPKAESDINMLKSNSGLWLSPESKRYYNNRYILYFSHLFSYGDGISKIMYGIDTDLPDTEILPPFSIGSENDNFMINIDRDFKKVVIKLYYADDTESDIKEFYF